MACVAVRSARWGDYRQRPMRSNSNASPPAVCGIGVDGLGVVIRISVVEVTEEDVVEMYRSGVPVAAVAESAGISTAELYRLLRRNGFESFRRKHPAAVTDRDRQIVDAYLDGDRRIDELAAEFEVPASQIYHSLRRLGRAPNRQQSRRILGSPGSQDPTNQRG